MTESLPPPEPNAFPELRADDLQVVGVDTRIGRVFTARGPHATVWNAFRRFGPTSARFDHHQPPPGLNPHTGVYYSAVQLSDRRGRREPLLKTCLAEGFQTDRTIDLEVGMATFAVCRPVRPLRLVDLTSPWVARSGGNGALTAGPRAMARLWARAIAGRYGSEIDGVFYASSVLPSGFVVALWEQAQDALPAHPLLHRALTEPAFRADIEVYARELGFGLLP